MIVYTFNCFNQKLTQGIIIANQTHWESHIDLLFAQVCFALTFESHDKNTKIHNSKS